MNLNLVVEEPLVRQNHRVRSVVAGIRTARRSAAVFQRKNLVASETLLDLGSGSDKACFLASKVVETAGRVIGQIVLAVALVGCSRSGPEANASDVRPLLKSWERAIPGQSVPEG